MFLGISPAQWGGIFLAIGVLLYWLRVFAVLRAVLAFLGTCLLAQGVLTNLLVRGARTVSGLTDSLAGKVFGVAIPGLLVIILAIILVYDLHPKGGGASKRTFWLAIAVAACLIAGVSTFSTLNGIPADVRTGVTTVTSGG